MKPTKIAVVSEDVTFPLDEGFKKAAYEIVSALRHICTTEFFSSGAALPPQTKTLPSNRLLLSQSLRRDLIAFSPDIILYIPRSAATPMSILRARMLKLQARGCPVAIISLQRRRYPRPLIWLVSQLKPDLLLVLSTKSQSIASSLNCPIGMIPLGVDIDRFRPPQHDEKMRLKSLYGIGGRKVVLHVGHLNPRRNINLLLGIPTDDISLVIVSSTTTKSDKELRDSLRQHGVIFLDTYIEKIEEVYRLADCYVFPTHSEKGAIEIPLSLLEAMATNLPVVTTPFGGIPDLFKDGNGLFITDSDADLLEKTRMATDLKEVRTRELVTNLTWKHVAQTILDRISELVA